MSINCIFISCLCFIYNEKVLQYQKVKFDGKDHQYITKTSPFKYTENFTAKYWKFSDNNSDILHISAQNLDCGYFFGSNEYPQSMFLSRNKKNNVYLCKPRFYCMKVGFKCVSII